MKNAKEKILKEDRLFVVGNPVAHSLSPFIHNRWLRRYGIAGLYDKRCADMDGLPALVEGVRDGEIKGFNVTVPHKQAVLPLMDALTPAARAIGAVNTVFCEDGRAVGDNTDAYGFYRGLLDACPDFVGKGKTALVIGAGGAARAALWALQEHGFARIYILNRTRDKAAALAADFPSVAEIYSPASPPADLVANTTSMGMKNNAPLRLDNAWLKPGGVVYDIVYAPRITPLLADAQALGAKTAGGLPMLAHQAACAFRRWYGILPDVDAELMAELAERAAT